MRSESLRRERRRKRNVIIIGLVMVFLMVFSMLAVIVNNPDAQNDLTYNGYEFTVKDMDGGQVVVTKVNGQEYFFYTLPQDALRMMENATGVQELVSANTLIFAKEPLGLGVQATSEQLYYNLLIYDLKSYSGKSVLSGISEKEDFSSEKVYDCGYASASSTVVLMKRGTFASLNMTKVEPYCFEFRSSGGDVLVLRDYLLYKSLGIIA
ncbi:MAG: hypothetical protein ACP5N3_03870 [Candidatus Nanoarchaeia archaeon]